MRASVLVFAIDEGAPLVMGGVQFEGNRGIGSDELFEVLSQSLLAANSSGNSSAGASSISVVVRLGKCRAGCRITRLALKHR